MDFGLGKGKALVMTGQLPEIILSASLWPGGLSRTEELT